MRLNMASYMRYRHLLWRQSNGKQLTQSEKDYIIEMENLLNER